MNSSNSAWIRFLVAFPITVLLALALGELVRAASGEPLLAYMVGIVAVPTAVTTSLVFWEVRIKGMKDTASLRRLGRYGIALFLATVAMLLLMTSRPS